MPKKREKNGEEWLRGQLREQAKELRQLRKQLKHYQKQEHIHTSSQDEEYGNDTEDTYPDETKIAKVRFCQSCGKGTLRVFQILDRISFEECDVCDYRKKITNG